jgi:hypothetical protein
LEALFGADDRISPRWHVTTSFSHGLASSDFSVAGSIEYAYDSDLRLRLLYGPKLQYIDPGLSGTVFGFQIVRSFDYDYAPSGAVDGRIFVDDQMCAVPVQVAIDDGDPVTCDKSGRFAITHLALGDHAVKIVPESLPADLSSDEADIPVTVASGKQVACNFHLHKVGQIVGSIDTTADQLGHLDPSARVAVVLHDSAGDIASTDLDGAFTISNLRAGQYSISIDERSLPPDYEVQEPKSVDVAVAPGGPPPKIHFTISPKAHTVIYETTH